MPKVEIERPDGSLGVYSFPKGITPEQIEALPPGVLEMLPFEPVGGEKAVPTPAPEVSQEAPDVTPAAPAPKLAPGSPELRAQVNREGALGARAVAEGVLGLPALVADIPANVINLGISGYNALNDTDVRRLAKPSDFISPALNTVLPQYETPAERIVAGGISTVAGLPAAGGTAKALANAAPGRMANWLRSYAAAPIGPQVAPAAAAGLAAAGAGEVTDDPVTPMAAALLAAGGTAGLQYAGRHGGNTLRSATRPITDAGRRKIATEFVAENVGRENIPAVTRALMESMPKVKGAYPTAGQAVAGVPAGSPIIAGQGVVAAQPGGASARFGQRFADQQAARKAVLDRIGGTADDLDAAIAARAKASGPLYQAAEKSKAQVKSGKVAWRVNDLLAKHKNETKVARPLRDIQRKIVLDPETGRLEKSPQQLIALSRDIGQKIGQRRPDGKPEFDVKVLKEVKNLLDETIEAAEPAYKEARRVFREQSAPVNRMQTAQFLRDKLVPPTGQESPGAYLRALDDATKLIKDSTGFPRAQKLTDIFSRSEVAQLRGVADDLEQTLRMRSPVQRTNISDAINFSGQNPRGPRMLSKPATITNWLLSRSGQAAEPKIYEILADRYLNPRSLAAELQGYMPPPPITMAPVVIPSATAAGAESTRKRKEK
jgi:hypothetical protein